MEKYTLQNTINDIMRDEFLMKNFSIMLPMEYLLMVPEDLRDISTDSLQRKLKMPWGSPYSSREVIDVANKLYQLALDSNFEFVKLWVNETEDGFFPGGNTEDTVCLIRYKDSFKENRPVAIIVPGGSYHDIAMSNEGMGVAKRLDELGYAVAILYYRVAPNRYPIPQTDLGIAIKYIRYNAKKFGVSDSVMTVGFSAGGHLVASEACYYEEIEPALMDALQHKSPELASKYKNLSIRPDKVCLAYPVINCISDNHEDSYVNLSGGGDEMREKLSIDRNVTADYPKTFVWSCEDDTVVPASNAKRMYEALQKVGVESELHIYPTGNHGIALGNGTSAEGWIEQMIEFMR